MLDFDTWGPTTLVAVLLTVIAAIAGAVVVVTDHAYPFDQYLDAMAKFVIGLGILGVGRGLRLHSESITRRPRGKRS